MSVLPPLADGADHHGPLPPMTAPQLRVLRVITQFYREYGEPPTASLIARRLKVHHSVVQAHLAALYRKGWLRTPTPSGLRCLHLP